MDGNRVVPRPWLLFLWPGVLRLWRDGDPVGLWIAACFGVVLNAALASSFLWADISTATRVVLWATVGLFWVVSLTMMLVRRMQGGWNGHCEDLFVRARLEYFKGDWLQAERELCRALKRDPGDAESRLLLATMMRRQRRLHEAREQLRRLECYERSVHWGLEIEREWQLIRSLVEEPNSRDDPLVLTNGAATIVGNGAEDAA